MNAFGGLSLLLLCLLTYLRSSSHFDCYPQCFRPVGDQTFFWSEETFYPQQAKKLTPNELIVNVLFAVAESYSLLGKAQR